MRKIVIVGAGFTGISLARMLSLEGRRVVLIDSDAERVRQASDQLDCTVLAANGNDLTVLEQAGISSADALVTLTADDEINMVTCSLVDAVYPDLVKIARVRNFAYYETVALTRRLARKKDAQRPLYGIDYMLNPEVEAAEAIGRAMEYGAIGNVVDLPAGWLITTVSIGEGSPLAGKSLAEIARLEGWHFLVAFVESGAESTVPKGATVLQAGDRIGVVSRTSDMAQVVSLTRSSLETFRRVVVFGADRVGVLIAARLAEKNRVSAWNRLFGSAAPACELTVVDQNPARCRQLAERFPDLSVVCGDIMDEALVEEERLQKADLLVAVSGNYERNLIQGAYMKTLGVKKCIVLASDATYDVVARKLGIDVVVPLRRTLVDGILGHLRGRQVKAIHSVCNRQFEIVEGVLPEKFAVAGKRLKDVARQGLQLLVLLAGPCAEKMEAPSGELVLTPGLAVVALVPSGDLKTLTALSEKV